jgi:NACalpha-BTF3-like transcription factor
MSNFAELANKTNLTVVISPDIYVENNTDISIVCEQVGNCSGTEAINAMHRCRGDIVDAILWLSP